MIGKCPDCELDNVKLTIEHTVPQMAGGPDVEWNREYVCRSCNSRRYTKLVKFAIRHLLECPFRCEGRNPNICFKPGQKYFFKGQDNQGQAIEKTVRLCRGHVDPWIVTGRYRLVE